MMLIHRPQAAQSILLVILLEITIAAVAWELVVRRKRARIVRRLALDWGMRFRTDDAYGLANRLAEHMPVPGSAKLRADDLVYQWEGDEFFSVFTISFTRGVIGAKHRKHQVAGVRQKGNEYSWVLAPGKGKLGEEYEYVRERLMRKKKEPGGD